VGLLLILTYTGWINKRPVICLIAPGVGFGLLMVVGTQFVLAGKYLALSWLAGLVPFFLVNNLLLINRYPDIRADSGVGRNNLAIAHGISISNRVYTAFVIATIVVITACVFTGKYPVLSLIALIPIPLAFFTLSGAMKYGENIGSYPQYLAANVIVALAVPTLLGVSLFVG
jgi:1,4-dihydroxy-2-naphthoate octaprenyltransferase